MLGPSFHLSKTARFSSIDVLGKSSASAGGSSKGSATDTDALVAAVVKQGNVVKMLKRDGGAPDAIAREVAVLKDLKVQLEAAKAQEGPEEGSLDRKVVEDLLLRRMFVVPSFEIHGSVAGLFDLGPPACALKANVVNEWRKHFVIQEGMLEMECTCLTPEVVLKTSGHVDRFTDLMVKDGTNGECFRADKLLEDFIDKLIDDNPTMQSAEVEKHRLVQRQADAYSPEEIHQIFQEYGIKSPSSGTTLSEPYPFNLMFKTSIGPEGTSVGYLRPETAQGLFVNFKRLLDFNGQKMPFAAAQIGLGFRNEISPRAGLIRVREFCMAEIEHFVHPQYKDHDKFHMVADKELQLFGQDDQLGSGKAKFMTIGKAVAEGLVNNQTLGYFMARTQLFAEKIGIIPAKMRFRQHLRTEMAHYAADCWDLEIETSYGWIECVGHADRACYDLQVHSEKTNVTMEASLLYKDPKKVEITTLKPNGGKIGPTFKAEQKKVKAALEALAKDDARLAAFQKELDSNGQADVDGYSITKEMVTLKKVKKTVCEEKYMPSVIEPSFGIGRILYCLLEHSFYTRKSDEQRAVMRFPALVAPIKCGIYNLKSTALTNSYVNIIVNGLSAAGVTNKADTASGSLGRRYARADEIGIPFGVTVDMDTLTTETVTLRERDTCAQIRLPIAELASLVSRLCQGQLTWDTAMKRYPLVRPPGEEEDDEGKSTAKGETGLLTIENTARGSFSRPAASIL
mmetsp:Transcript_29931/g.39331  ORF Transcript_29931/g.39331 Transcript_29931/m.39331 type:complete len:738 (-) Transcript_29931:294-2507(-)